MEQLERAMLAIDWGDGKKPDTIPVQFNPTELTFDKSVQIAEINIPGLDSPLLQFVRGQNEKLTMELFFDSTEDGMGDDATSVTKYTDRVYQLVKIVPQKHAPPVCSFLWNDKFPGADVEKIGNQKRNEFRCIVESVKQTFTLFSPEGVPLRAKLSVTLREYKTLGEQLSQLGLSSPDRTHSHVSERGDTLSSVAAKYYRRADKWRNIAEENGIEDPRRLHAGKFLRVPPIT